MTEHTQIATFSDKWWWGRVGEAVVRMPGFPLARSGRRPQPSALT